MKDLKPNQKVSTINITGKIIPDYRIETYKHCSFADLRASHSYLNYKLNTYLIQPNKLDSINDQIHELEMEMDRRLSL